MKTCPYCDLPVEDNVKFCTNCGGKIDIVPEYTEPVQESVQQQYTAPQESVQQQYTAPQEPVQQQYTAPQEPVQQQYTMPQEPVQQQYTAPQEPVQQYTMPQEPMQQQYTAPQEPVQQQYTMPQEPEQQYTAPQEPVQQQYTAPQEPMQQQYTAPQEPVQQQYTAPQNGMGYAPGGSTPYGNAGNSYGSGNTNSYGGNAGSTGAYGGNGGGGNAGGGNGGGPYGGGPYGGGPYGGSPYGQQAMAPQPKKKSKLPVFIAAGAALAIVIIAIVLLFGKGGKSKDPNAGDWKAVSAEMLGVSVDVEDTFGGEFIITLKDGGKAKIVMGDQKASAKWTLDGETFNIKGGGLDCTGTLKNGDLYLEDVLGSGVSIHFVKTDAEASGKDSTAAKTDSTYYVIEKYGDFDPDLIEASGMKETEGIELQKDGRIIFYSEGTKIPGEIKDGQLTLNGIEDDMGYGEVTVTDEAITFNSEVGEIVYKAVAEKPAFMDMAGAYESQDSPDSESSSTFESPTKQMKYPSKWYGYARFYDMKGKIKDEFDGDQIEDVWAVFDYDSEGKLYFEVYESDIDNTSSDELRESLLMSMYANEDSESLLPAIIEGNEDAWILDTYLTQSDAWDLYTPLSNGALDINMTYNSEEAGSCGVQIFLRELGAPWDEEGEELPPDYETNYSDYR